MIKLNVDADFIEISDINGLTWIKEDNCDGGIIRIDVRDLQKGMYFLSAFYKNKRLAIRKLLVD